MADRGVLLALEAAITAYEYPRHGVRGAVKALPVAAPGAVLLMMLRAWLEQDRVRRLGLTSETLPRRSFGNVAANLAVLLAWRATLWVRGAKVPRLTWSQSLSHSIIREVDRRRAWRRAGGPTRRVLSA